MKDVLLQALEEIREIYAGIDGFIPETAPEAYQQMKLKQMYDIACGAIRLSPPEGELKMETKYTPGPWRVLLEKQVDDDCKHEGEIVVDVVADAYRHLICYTPISGNKDAHANALLIAAAPDMADSINPDELLRDLALADTLQQICERTWDNGLCILARELRERTEKRQAAYSKATSQKV